MWINSTDEEREVWKKWQMWDKLRYKRDCIVYKQSKRASPSNDTKKSQLHRDDDEDERQDDSQKSSFHIPKKKRLVS